MCKKNSIFNNSTTKFQFSLNHVFNVKFINLLSKQ
jgi:hypothetical protein